MTSARTSAGQPADDRPGSAAAGQPAADAPLRPAARRAIVASVIGTVIEWYDYALYGAAAGLVIGPLFFPDSVFGAGQLSALATFAVGFLARPVGGIVIGHIGDRHGRRPAMILTIVLMAIATVAIGLLPTAAAVGVLAPILLVIFRFLQGFGAGAELSGATTMVAEYVPVHRRGFFTSLVLCAPPAGIVLATAAFFLASSGMAEETFMSIGWRLPFLASVVLFFVAIYIRAKLEETPEYTSAMEQQAARATKVPLLALLATDWRGVLAGFLSLTGHNALNYGMAVFSIGYLVGTGMPQTHALGAVTLGTVAAIILTPLGGSLADRFGAGRVMGWASVIGALYSFPFLWLLSQGTFTSALIAIAIGYGLVISGTSGSQGAFLANLFPTRHRFSAMALAREANGALIAGFSPVVLAALVAWANGAITAAAGYLVACCLLSAAAIFLASLGRRRGVGRDRESVAG
ncbi:MFS transporter [Brevibacterium luteolum]|uniref:MFS transporter n=1 Tax=Brevibacterium luteolum TaxID=199591 RepID=UPI003B67FCD9